MVGLIPTTLRSRQFMDNLATTLCEQIKLATSDDLDNLEQKENAAEAISQTIDQIPQIKNYLDEGLKEYYEIALPKTEKNVQKNIYKFIERYKINLSRINCRDNKDKNTIKKYFIKWISMILKRRCIDAYRTQKRRNKNNQPGVINKSLNEKKYGEDSTSETIDTIKDPKITISGLGELIKNEQQKIKSKITQYIETDPDNQLKNLHPRNRPDCNCQVLLKKKLIEGEYNVTNIANESKIARATLQDFLEYRPNSKRADAKCLRLLKKEIEAKYQINLSEYKDI